MIDTTSELNSITSFHKPKHPNRALIYNQYLQTAGGGERLCFEIALALEQLGYEINFVIASEIKFDPIAIANKFGIFPKSKWKFHNVEKEKHIANLCKEELFDVFINNTFGSLLENLAPFGLYVTMFPIPVTETERENLATYTVIYSISDFTDIYVKSRWSSPNSSIIIPPISDVNFSKRDTYFSEKEKLIICVGRFNVGGHSKCQLEAIETFVKFQDEGIIDSDWKLAMVGRVNEGTENLSYLGKCVKAASKNVSIYESLSLDDLMALYRRASALWQFTGIGKGFGVSPEVCEHLGLVALDCFAYGTIPIVFQRSGVAYLISHGIDGYCFMDEKELAEIMKSFCQNFGNGFHKYQFENSKLTAGKYTYGSFVAQFKSLLDGSSTNASDHQQAAL